MIFTKLINAKWNYVYISCAKFHANRSINIKSKYRSFMYTLTYDGQLVELYETHMCLMIFLKKAHMEFYTNTTGDLILMSRHRQPDAVSIKELLLLCESHRKIMESSGKPLSLPTVEGRSYPCSVGLSGAFVKLLKANISFIMSVCPFVRPSTWNNSTPNGRIFKKKKNCHLNIF